MKISKLARSQRVEGRILVYLEDGTLLRLGEQDVVRFGLYAGRELEETELDALREAVQLAAVKHKALELIAARPLSKKELKDKLTARPRKRESAPLATPEQADAVVARLEELGYLNDEDYARMLVRHYAAKGYGVYKIREELYRRGISRELWETALDELEEGGSAINAFVEKRLRGRTMLDQKEWKRLSDALVRRGFSWSEVRDALRRYGAEEE